MLTSTRPDSFSDVPRLRAVAAASTALVLGLGASLLIASPANAAQHDITTPGWEWYDVEDNTTSILEADAIWEDFYGLTNFRGWTSDAFDGFIQAVTMTDNSVQPAVTDVVDLTNDSVDIHDNGLTTIVAHGVAQFAEPVDVLVTLKIQGSYAQWSFEFDDGGAGILGDVDVDLTGDLGSDDDTVIYYNSGPDLVTSEDFLSDPVIGHHLETTGPFTWTVADGNGLVAVEFNAAATTSYTLALADYDPCQFDRAISEMVTRSGSLDQTFGESIEPYYEAGCVVAAAAAPISLGSATNQALPISGTAEWLQQQPPFQGFNVFTGFAVDGLPAGLSATIAYNPVTTLSEVVITGTATTPGNYLVTMLGYFAYPDLDRSPLFITVP